MNSADAIEAALELHRSGRNEEARALYRQILEEKPTDVSVTHLLGLTYLSDPDWRQGIALIEQVIKLRPKMPVYHFNLGVGWRDHGEFEAARSSFRRAIDLKADYGEAWHAWVQTQKYSEGGADLDHIREQLGRQLDDGSRCFFSFAAGKICDDIGAYDEAFQHYQRGNQLNKGRWLEREYVDCIEQIKSTFSAALLAARSEWGVAGSSPIFIVGMPRSGSSLAEQILASHPQVFGAGELQDIPSIAKDMGERITPAQPYPQCIPFLPPHLFAGLGRAYLTRIAGLVQAPGLRSVDKLPLNFLHVGTIRLLFPDAKIIHTRRDPLDTCLSCYFQKFSRHHEFCNNLETLGRYCRQYQDLMAHWRSVMPGQIFELDYESLIVDPEQTARALLDFCELPWDENCLAFANTRRRVATASSWQVRQPLYSSSSGRWRHYEKYLAPLVSALR